MARFWVGGGTNTNWNSSPVTNWAASSGGAGNQTVPDITQDVTFDGAGSGNGASIISTTISCLSLTFTTGYTNTITHNAVLTIAGNVTFQTTYTIAGTSSITISAASTIDSNGKTWPNAMTFSGTNTKTLSENLSVTGSFTVSGASTVINGNTLNLAGGLQMTNTCSGTTVFNLTGGTWSTGSVLQNSLTIAGNVTISSGVSYSTGTFTYSSGTVTTTGSTLTITGSTTLNTAGISFNNITFSATGTQTINSFLTVNGTIQIANGATLTFAGTAGFTCGTLNCLHTTAANLTFKNGLTYTVITSFQSYLAPNSGGNVFVSDDGTAKTNIVLANTNTLCNTNGRFTRVDASGGRPIITFNNTITNCINVYLQNNVLFRPVESFNRSGRRAELLNKNKAVIYN